jgi:hypothetical protein
VAGFICKLAVVIRRETGPIHNAIRPFFSADIMRFDDLTKHYALAVAAFQKRPDDASEQAVFWEIREGL